MKHDRFGSFGHSVPRFPCFCKIRKSTASLPLITVECSSAGDDSPSSAAVPAHRADSFSPCIRSRSALFFLRSFAIRRQAVKVRTHNTPDGSADFPVFEAAFLLRSLFEVHGIASVIAIPEALRKAQRCEICSVPAWIQSARKAGKDQTCSAGCCKSMPPVIRPRIDLDLDTA